MSEKDAKWDQAQKEKEKYEIIKAELEKMKTEKKQKEE